MTGVEIVGGAAAKGAGQVVRGMAKDLTAEQKAVNRALLDEVRQTPEFAQAVHLYGARQAIKQAFATTWWKRFAWLNRVPSEYLDNAFVPDLTEKLEAIPESDLQMPKRSIARQALEGLDDSADEPELQKMYLELLAKAFDAKYSELAHPGFVNVLRQLSGAEADYLRTILPMPENNDASAIVALDIHHSPGISQDPFATHIMDMRENGIPVEVTSMPAYVDNWIRLGLVSVRYDAWLSDEDAYDWVKERPEFAAGEAVARARPLPAGGEVTSFDLTIEKGVMRPTAFGRSFALAVGMAGALERP